MKSPYHTARQYELPLALLIIERIIGFEYNNTIVFCKFLAFFWVHSALQGVVGSHAVWHAQSHSDGRGKLGKSTRWKLSRVRDAGEMQIETIAIYEVESSIVRRPFCLGMEGPK